ncbi:response regulator [Chloroflexota bacterium]
MIKVVVADKHALFREGLTYILNNEEGVKCIGIAVDGEEAVRLSKKLSPDIALIDVDLPKLTGTDAITKIKSASPTTRVILLTHNSESHHIEAALASGADGYLLKDIAHDQLMNAIHSALAGEGMFNLKILKKTSPILSAHKNDVKGKLLRLRNREIEILKLVALGMSNKEIADKLYISTHTVGIHLVNLFKKLCVESRTAAVAYAIREGLVDPSDFNSNDKD